MPENCLFQGFGTAIVQVGFALFINARGVVRIPRVVNLEIEEPQVIFIGPIDLIVDQYYSNHPSRSFTQFKTFDSQPITHFAMADDQRL